MNTIAGMSRVAALLMLLMAALLVLSALNPADADARKKKINTVTCKVGIACNGTPKKDKLNGTSSADTLDGKAMKDQVYGKEGDDIYIASSGGDSLNDGSSTSNDTYKFTTASRAASYTVLVDNGGASDVIDLSSFSRDEFNIRQCNFYDVCIEEINQDGGNRILIDYRFRYFSTAHKIEQIKFSDQTVTNF